MHCDTSRLLKPQFDANPETAAKNVLTDSPQERACRCRRRIKQNDARCTQDSSMVCLLSHQACKNVKKIDKNHKIKFAPIFWRRIEMADEGVGKNAESIAMKPQCLRETSWTDARGTEAAAAG